MRVERKKRGNLELAVGIPTFNNLATLQSCLASWRENASHLPIEIVVIEDGCSDGTGDFLAKIATECWHRAKFSWVHEENVHELRCTNRGLRETKAPLFLAWQDDMLLRSKSLIPELIELFERHPDIGLLSLSRGLNCFPLDEPVSRWEDLTDWRRLQSTIGPAPWNWFYLQEVDAVVRPWVIRRDCLNAAGMLDEIFCPSEWDEADLCFRIRRAGWKVATHGFERARAYEHLGSTTLGRTFTDAYKNRVLRNGQVFLERWSGEIERTAHRRRKHWPRSWRHLVGVVGAAVRHILKR